MVGKYLKFYEINMKYFTKKWCFSELSDDEINNNINLYNRYINFIYDNLPVTLKLLLKSISLHDGIINSVTYVKSKKFLELSGIFGDLQFGYYNLIIKYLNINHFEKKYLEEILNNNDEILRDEIEKLSNSNYSHKFIFNSGNEFEIVFSDIELYFRNSSSKEYKKKKCKINIKN